MNDQHKPKPNIISAEDIERLRDGTTDARVEIAAKVGWSIDHYPLTDEEMALAIQVVALLLGDSAPQVRMALAETLKESDKAPKDFLLRLARDQDGQVAYPVLKTSNRFLDEELLSIIRETQELIRLMAIAERQKLSAIVSGALIDKAIESLVETVLRNPGAEVDEADMLRVSDHYYESEYVLKAMMHRDPIPQEAVSRMVTNASQAIKSKLHFKSVTEEDPADSVQFSHEALMADLEEIRKLGQKPTVMQSQELASNMNIRGRMTPQFQVAVLLLGYYELFASCIAKQARKDYPEVENLLRQGKEGFNLVFKLTRLPAGMLEMLATLYEAVLALRTRGLMPGNAAFLECLNSWVDDAATRRILYVESFARKLHATLKSEF